MKVRYVSAHQPQRRAPVLVMAGVRRSYEQGAELRTVLEGVNLQVYGGEVVALVGPSGSGKSTLLHLAAGLDLPDQGRVSLSGQDLGRLTGRERAQVRRQELGFVFQSFHLLPTLTVTENVELPLLLSRQSRPGAVQDLLEQLGIAHRADAHPGILSGGERQRVAIARALVMQPALVVADEPTGALDRATGRVVLDILVSTVRTSGAALLVATHDDHVAASADRVLAVSDGQLSERTPQPQNLRA